MWGAEYENMLKFFKDLENVVSFETSPVLKEYSVTFGWSFHVSAIFRIEFYNSLTKIHLNRIVVIAQCWVVHNIEQKKRLFWYFEKTPDYGYEHFL